MVYLSFNSSPQQTIDAIYNGATITVEYEKSYKDYLSKNFNLYSIIFAISAIASVCFTLFAKMTPNSLRVIPSSFALIFGFASFYYFKKDKDYYLNLVLPQEKGVERILLDAKSYLLFQATDPHRFWDRNRFDQVKSIVDINFSFSVPTKAWSEFSQGCRTYFDAMKKFD